MAFITSACSSFLGSPISIPTARAISSVRPVVYMTATRPTRELSNLPESDLTPEIVHLMPPCRRIDVKEGDLFSFVRYYVDDFMTKPYFDGLTGSGVRIAVLDTGCDATHPALKNRIDVEASKNYTPDYNGDPRNFSDASVDREGRLIGHGTHCAGIIAAEDLKAIMYGVAPEATIVVKKVLSNRGEPYNQLQFLPVRIARAIRDATAEGCEVISMSLAVYEVYHRRYMSEMREMYSAVQEALAAGVTICVAAGNSGKYPINTIEPPGAYGGVITVAAHDDAGNRNIFSSYGGELDFMAPGQVFSTKVGGGYHALEGTSMATPLVAGLAALLIEAGGRSDFSGLSEELRRDMYATGYRARDNYEVREMLRLLAERPNEHTRVDGYGRLYRAYQYVNGHVSDLS